MRWALALLALVAAPARCTGQGPDPLVKPMTRLSPGCTVALAISVGGIDEQELCGRFTLDAAGRLGLTVGRQPIAPVDLRGATVEEARPRIAGAVRKYYVGALDVRLSILRVPRIQVVVEGATFRSGVIPLAEGSRLSDALADTGYMPNADLEHVRIARIQQDGARQALVANFAKALRDGGDTFADPLLQQADRITLDLVAAPVVQRAVGVYGEVRRPGYYPYTPGMTVRDALLAGSGMLPGADSERVSILRPGSRSCTVVDGQKALGRIPTDDLELRPDDVVSVAARDSARRYVVMGEVASPASFEHRGRVMLTGAIVAAGGFKPDADRRRLVLVRNMLGDPTRATTVQVDYDRIARGEAPDVPIDSGDAVQVPRRPRMTFSWLDLGLSILRFVLP